MSYDSEDVAADRKAAIVAAAPTFQSVALSVPGAEAVADAAAEMNTADTSVLVGIANELDTRIAALEGVDVPATGYQSQSHAAASVDSSTSETSYVNVPGYSGWTFAAPQTKTYLVAVDCTAFLSGFTFAALDVALLVDGSIVGERRFISAVDGGNLAMSFHCPAAMSAGNRDVRLAWKMGSGVTASTTADCHRTFSVLG